MNKAQFIFEGKTYHINKIDQKKIKEGASYFDIIFPNEKDMYLINNIDADFHIKNGNGLEEGLYIYEKSCTTQQMQLLEQKLPIKSGNKQIKKNKI